MRVRPKFNSEAGNIFPDQSVTGVLRVLSTAAGP
jgi:hypothetical protein